MKIGFFTSILPDGRPSSGFEIANEAILEALRTLGHDVVSVGVQLPRQTGLGDGSVRALSVTDLENAVVGKRRKFEWLARSIASGLPFAAGKLRGIGNRALDTALREAGPFDLHIVNSYQMGAAFPQLLEKPYIYVAHNVENETAAQNAHAATSGFERLLYRRDARLLRDLEPKLAKHADAVWTLSEEDRSWFADHSASCSVLPLTVPELSIDHASAKAFDAGLIGTWSWEANRVGLAWFLDDVVPLLPADFLIAIAGSVPPGLLPKRENVTMLGRVDSAEGFLSGVRVVPLVSRGGTGVQLKTIEALQAGLSCVATSSSLRGIDVLPDNCRTTDEPRAFAEALVELAHAARTGTMAASANNAFREERRERMLDVMRADLEH